MSMPYIDDDIEEEIETESVEDFEITGKNLKMDFANKDIKVSDGDTDTITGEAALKQWIRKVFMTRAYVYPIYDTEETATEEDEEETYEDTGTDVYGSNVREIMMDPDMDWAEKTAEVQLDIENVLSRHPDIIEVSDFSFTQKGRTMVVKFTVSSIYGADFNEEVVINGTNS